MPDSDLEAIDAALLRMRRMWLKPASKAQLRRDLGEGIEMSSVLVADAVSKAAGQGEVTVAVVASELQVERSTASRLVDSAARAGFVARMPSERDARRTVVTLTDAGYHLIERAVAFRRSHLERYLEGWPLHDRSEFARLLDRFATAVADVEPGD